MEPRLVLFDCDGTLIDSAGAILAAVRSAFAENGLPAPETPEVHAIIGLSLPHAMSALARDHPTAPHDALVAAYKTAYRRSVMAGSECEPLFPGIAGALARMDDAGTLLGIVTGKSRRGLRRALDAHGLTDRFFVTRTADDAASKPAPDMVIQCLAQTGVSKARSVVVGDTVFDIEMGRSAGIRTIAVSWGAHEIAALEAAGADAVAYAAADLPRIVDALLPHRTQPSVTSQQS